MTFSWLALFGLLSNVWGIFIALFALAWFVLRPLLIVGIEWRKKKIEASLRKHRHQHAPPSGEEHAGPGISILLPCHNAEETLADTVEQILKQDYPGPLEVLLLQNGSRDRTPQIAEELAERHPGVVRCIHIEGSGGMYKDVSRALNTGISAARYEILVRLDDDTSLEEGCFETLASHFADPEVTAVACNVRLSNPGAGIWSRLQSLEYFFSMELDRRFQTLIESLICCSGAFGAFRKRTVCEAGGYTIDPYCSEDFEMTLKMHERGRIRYEPKAVAYTASPVSLRQLFRQRFRWARNGVGTLLAHRRTMFNRRFGHRGLMGVVGLPLKAAFTIRHLIGLVVKVGAGVVTALVGNPLDGLLVFAIISLMHFVLVVFKALMIAPIAHAKQGLLAVLWVPVFSLVYQPALSIIKACGILAALWIAWQRADKQLQQPHLAPFFVDRPSLTVVPTPVAVMQTSMQTGLHAHQNTSVAR